MNFQMRTPARKNIAAPPIKSSKEVPRSGWRKTSAVATARGCQVLPAKMASQTSILAEPGIHTNCLNEANAPVPAEDGAAPSVLACLSRRAAGFGDDDLRLVVRFAGLAAQVLANHALAERNALLAAVVEGSSASVVIAEASGILLACNITSCEGHTSTGKPIFGRFAARPCAIYGG